MRQSIFVAIPAYRDPETTPTIVDLFEKASGKYIINVGVFWQLSNFDYADIKNVLRKYNIRNLFCTHNESKGCCWVRNRIFSELYGGETYTLSIDSHTRFVQDWDVKLINLIQKYDKAHVISTYPNSYEPPNTIISNYPHKIQAHGKNKDGLPLLSPINCEPKPAVNYYIAAGFLFCYSHVLQKIKYDKFLYFTGEEISLAIRLFIHGITIINPGTVILYHYYVRKNSVRHWNDNNSAYDAMFRNNSIRRVKHLLELEHCDDPNVLQDLDQYGLGTVRPLNEYFNITGIKNLPLSD